MIMALEEERGRAHAAEPTPVASPAPTHEDLSYLEPIVYPGANNPVNPWRTHRTIAMPEDNRWHWRWWRLWALPSLAFLTVATVAVVRLYGQAVDHGDLKSLIMPFLFLGTLWWNCNIHTLNVMSVRRMNPTVAYNIVASITP